MMYLPAEVRADLSQKGIDPPPDGTPELAQWLRSIRTEQPDVYRFILQHASASGPPPDSERIQQRQQQTSYLSKALRRAFSKRTATGERVSNRKFATVALMVGATAVLLILMVVAAMAPPVEQPAAETAPVEQPAGGQQAPVAAEQQAPAAAEQQPQAPAAAGQPLGPPLGAMGGVVQAFPPVPQAQLGQVVPELAMPGQQPAGNIVFAQVVPPQQELRVIIHEQARPQGGAPQAGVIVSDRTSPAQAAPAGGGGVVVFDAAAQAQRDARPGAATPAQQGDRAAAPPEMPAHLRFTPGQRIEGVLATGIVAAQGGAPVPVVVVSNGVTWMGAAQVGPASTIQVALEQAVSGGVVVPLRAVILDHATQAAALTGNVRVVNPQQAQTLMAGVAQGVAAYMQALAQAGQTVVTNGWVRIVTGGAGPWWTYILGGVAEQVPQMAPQGERPVTVVEVARGRQVTILVLGTGPAR
jgi:hypothetical protein